MLTEISVAAAWWADTLRNGAEGLNYLPLLQHTDRYATFFHVLSRLLEHKFSAHWYPQEPLRGCAFRSLSYDHRLDGILKAAMKEIEMNEREASMILQHVRYTVMKINPGMVKITKFIPLTTHQQQQAPHQVNEKHTLLYYRPASTAQPYRLYFSSTFLLEMTPALHASELDEDAAPPLHYNRRLADKHQKMQLELKEKDKEKEKEKEQRESAKEKETAAAKESNSKGNTAQSRQRNSKSLLAPPPATGSNSQHKGAPQSQSPLATPVQAHQSLLNGDASSGTTSGIVNPGGGSTHKRRRRRRAPKAYIAVHKESLLDPTLRSPSSSSISSLASSSFASTDSEHTDREDSSPITSSPAQSPLSTYSPEVESPSASPTFPALSLSVTGFRSSSSSSLFFSPSLITASSASSSPASSSSKLQTVTSEGADISADSVRALFDDEDELPSNSLFSSFRRSSPISVSTGALRAAHWSVDHTFSQLPLECGATKNSERSLFHLEVACRS